MAEGERERFESQHRHALPSSCLSSFMPPRPLRETRLQIVERNKREIRQRTEQRIATLFEEARLKEIEEARLKEIEEARLQGIANRRSVFSNVCWLLCVCVVIILLAKVEVI